MANMSDYLENKLIDQIFRAQAFTFPGTLFFALATTTPTDSTTGATVVEVTGGSYARQSIATATNTFTSTNGATTGASTGTGGTTSQVAAITFPTATADWGTVVGIVITDSGTTAAGNALFWATLTANKVVGNGDTFQFAAGNLSAQIDN
jgi:hypothetical protein